MAIAIAPPFLDDIKKSPTKSIGTIQENEEEDDQSAFDHLFEKNSP